MFLLVIHCGQAHTDLKPICHEHPGSVEKGPFYVMGTKSKPR